MPKLKERPQFRIYDSSKVQDFMTCPRKYFFNHVLGWSQEEPNSSTDTPPEKTGGLFGRRLPPSIKTSKSVDLVFGSAWHAAQETLLRMKRDQKVSRGYPTNAWVQGMASFYAVWNEHFSPGDEERFRAKRKTPSRAAELLELYVERYSQDDFKVLETEIAGTVDIDGIKIAFVIDAICEDADGQRFVLEHKTTGLSLSGFYFDQWRQKVQIGVYTAALRALYPDSIGLVVNATNVRSAKVDSMFQRTLFKRSDLQMEDLVHTLGYWIGVAEAHTDLVLEEQDQFAKDPVMFCFPKNTESCVRYGRCTYMDYCEARPNPLLDIEPPPGFIYHLWDPITERREMHQLDLTYKRP